MTDLQTKSAASTAAHRTSKYGFIDALRGYAVLLVITTHTGKEFAELPYPVKKLTDFGWHGVQLFFLMSCVTLLFSWRADQARGTADLGDFLTRRVFRIAPMYYAAGLLYLVIAPPSGGFQPLQALATALFVNTWHPVLTPTVANGWTVVPGGWSVGVEFTFYLLFPVFAALVGTWRRALAMVAAGLAIGCVANIGAEALLLPTYGATPTSAFLYFWFFNQFPVFAMGAVLHHVLVATWAAPEWRVSRLLRRYGTWVAAGCVGLCLVLANLPLPGRLPFTPPLYMPRLFAASAVFMLFALALGHRERSPFNNRWIRSLGQVSFSAYLLHFAVLQGLTAFLPAVFDKDTTGVRAIVVCGALLVCVVPITHGLALVTFRAIEKPMINVGRRLIARRRDREATLRVA